MASVASTAQQLLKQQEQQQQQQDAKNRLKGAAAGFGGQPKGATPTPTVAVAPVREVELAAEVKQQP